MSHVCGETAVRRYFCRTSAAVLTYLFLLLHLHIFINRKCNATVRDQMDNLLGVVAVAVVVVVVVAVPAVVVVIAVVIVGVVARLS